MTANASNIAPFAGSQTSPKRITILGSTGSIGKHTIQLLEEQPHAYEVIALTANGNVELLAEQAIALNAQKAVIADEGKYMQLKQLLMDTKIEAAAGKDAVEQAASEAEDWVISAIVGAAALAPTLAAIESGATIAMANKECLVCAGELVNKALKKHDSTLIPVDSEHNALFQVFDFERVDSIEAITLTASGGPFHQFSLIEMEHITPKEAIKHPNWNMGAKISVDSATMMNKGLEVIEAYHLFPVEKNQVEVVVHPESVIHGLVHYQDGSVLAGLSQPDMRMPIAYALGWPDRLETESPRLSLTELGAMHFYAPDTRRFPALKVAQQVLEAGGTAPVTLNAANEMAVAAFISEEIGFLDIVPVVQATLDKAKLRKVEQLEDVLAADQKAREIAKKQIRKRK